MISTDKETTKLEMLRSRILTRMQDARCPDYPKLCGNEDCGMEAVILAEFEEAAREEAKRPTCVWSQEDGDSNLYEGSCGIAWEFMDGGPGLNGANYCFRCGGKIEEASDEG